MFVELELKDAHGNTYMASVNKDQIFMIKPRDDGEGSIVMSVGGAILPAVGTREEIIELITPKPVTKKVTKKRSKKQ